MRLRFQLRKGLSHAALACLLSVAAALGNRACAQPAAVADSPAQPQAEQIDRWVEQLGDDSFTVRKAAAENLLAAGTPARERLQDVVTGPDPELRAAAKRIVSLIETTDFRRRLDAFAADVDGKAGLSLPGWEFFSELVGGDAKCRALFVEIERHEAPLLAAVFHQPPTPRDVAWDERLTQLLQWQMTGAGQNVAPPLASCAALLLVSAKPKTELPDRTVMMLATLIARPPLQDGMQNGTHRDALRRLVAAWIVECPNNSDMSLQQRIALAGQNDLVEVVPLAVSVALSEPKFRQATPLARMRALLLIGQLGKREQLDAIESLLDDATVCFSTEMVNPGAPGGANVDVQIRDIALMVLLRLTEQNPSGYGYKGFQARVEQAFNPIQLAPPSAQQRTLAIAKWRTWREQDRGKAAKAAKAEKEKSDKEKSDAAAREADKSDKR